MSADGYSLYDYRPEEVEAARRIRRERIAALLEIAVGAPLLAVAAAVLGICLCVM